MNHYEKLGVEPNATDEDIKKAYRQKATQTHPDKGGSDEEFAAVAHAYETLKDPKRRLLYDSTGQDNRLPIEKEVESCLLELFSEGLSGSKDCSVIENAKTSIKAAMVRFTNNRKGAMVRQEKLTKKRDKIKSTSKVNLVHMLIDQELHSIKGYLLKIDHDEEVANKALEQLESYSEDWEAPKPIYMDFGTNKVNVNDFYKIIMDEVDSPLTIEDLIGDKK